MREDHSCPQRTADHYSKFSSVQFTVEIFNIWKPLLTLRANKKDTINSSTHSFTQPYIYSFFGLVIHPVDNLSNKSASSRLHVCAQVLGPEGCTSVCPHGTQGPLGKAGKHKYRAVKGKTTHTHTHTHTGMHTHTCA